MCRVRYFMFEIEEGGSSWKQVNAHYVPSFGTNIVINICDKSGHQKLQTLSCGAQMNFVKIRSLFLEICRLVWRVWSQGQLPELLRSLHLQSGW